MALMLAASAASDISPGWMLRGLRGFFSGCGDRRDAVPSVHSGFHLIEGLPRRRNPSERGRTGRGKGGAKRRDSGRPARAAGRTRPLRRTGAPCFFSHFLLPRPVLRVMSRTGQPAAARFAARTRGDSRSARSSAGVGSRSSPLPTRRSRSQPSGAAGRRTRHRRMCRSDRRSRANEASGRGRPPCRRRARRRRNSTRLDWNARYARMYC